MGCIAAVEGDEAAGMEACVDGIRRRKWVGAIGRYMAVALVGRGLEVARELAEGMVGL